MKLWFHPEVEQQGGSQPHSAAAGREMKQEARQPPQQQPRVKAKTMASSSQPQGQLHEVLVGTQNLSSRRSTTATQCIRGPSRAEKLEQVRAQMLMIERHIFKLKKNMFVLYTLWGHLQSPIWGYPETHHKPSSCSAERYSRSPRYYQPVCQQSNPCCSLWRGRTELHKRANHQRQLLAFRLLVYNSKMLPLLSEPNLIKHPV